MDERRDLGNAGEDEACRFLEAHGMRILERQVRCEFGELDIVAEDGHELVFVEVKTRESAEFGEPEEAITKGKLRRLAQLVDWYVQTHGATEQTYRLDVIGVKRVGDGWEVRHTPRVDIS